MREKTSNNSNVGSTSFFDLPSEVLQQICQHSINMSVNPQQQVQTLSLVAKTMKDETTKTLNTSFKNTIITLIKDVLYLPLEYFEEFVCQKYFLLFDLGF